MEGRILWGRSRRSAIGAMPSRSDTPDRHAFSPGRQERWAGDRRAKLGTWELHPRGRNRPRGPA
eukprot:9558970-Lingulodinium_polyedra.AAC.1